MCQVNFPEIVTSMFCVLRDDLAVDSEIDIFVNNNYFILSDCLLKYCNMYSLQIE